MMILKFSVCSSKTQQKGAVHKGPERNNPAIIAYVFVLIVVDYSILCATSIHVFFLLERNQTILRSLLYTFYIHFKQKKET